MFILSVFKLKNIRGLQELDLRLGMSYILKINEVNLTKNEKIRK